MKPQVVWPEHLQPFMTGERLLNAGCGANHLPGWVNMDVNPAVKPDVRHNLESPFLPFRKGSFDVVFASHVLEHIRNLYELMAAFHNILVVGGRLIIFTPYATSDDAFEDPHHVRMFNENSWAYFDDRIYQNPGTHGTLATQCDPVRQWDIAGKWLIPYDEFKEDPGLEFKKKHFRNIIREMHVVLIKRGARDADTKG